MTIIVERGGGWSGGIDSDGVDILYNYKSIKSSIHNIRTLLLRLFLKGRTYRNPYKGSLITIITWLHPVLCIRLLPSNFSKYRKKQFYSNWHGLVGSCVKSYQSFRFVKISPYFLFPLYACQMLSVRPLSHSVTLSIPSLFLSLTHSPALPALSICLSCALTLSHSDFLVHIAYSLCLSFTSLSVCHIH